MKNKMFILVSGLLLSLILLGCTNKEEQKAAVLLPVYSQKISTVEDLGLVTGALANPSTLDKYNIGGTDLGIPYYDSTRNKMYLLFGDTFSGINNMSGDWRSQTVGISTDFNLSDGLTFDSFISDRNGKAIQIIDAMHDANGAGGERTCIPTGGIAINGVHYVFYMSIREWLSVGWDINFCALAKSTDAQNFEILTDMFWTEEGDLGKENATILLNQTAENAEAHEAEHFLQIFPYQIGDYVYLFGLTAGRFGGCKLGRVKTENIENFEDAVMARKKAEDDLWEYIKDLKSNELFVDKNGGVDIEQ